MKKLLCLLVLLSLVLLTGCHGKKDSVAFTIPRGIDDSKTYSISFWAKNDTNKAQTDIYNKAIEDFEKLYPNIHVSIKLYTDYSRIYNDVITNIQTDSTPNVCITYPDHIATYMSSENTVVSLDELMNDGSYGLGGSKLKFDGPKKAEIVPQFLNECILEGRYYALPYMRSTEACYVNKTYVEKLNFTLPVTLTWDFVWQVSEAAMAKNADGTFAVNGQNTMIPFIWKSTDNMMIQYLNQSGTGYSKENGDILMLNDATAAFLNEIYAHALSRSFSTFKISSYPANFLNAGQCIFAVDSTAGATWMGSKAPLLDIAEESIVDFETVVMTIPQLDPTSPSMISQGPSICIFNKEDPEEVLASWLFAQFLLTNDVQTAYAETEGYVPVTLKAQQSEQYIDYLANEGADDVAHYDVKIKASKLLIANTDNTFVTPVFNGSASLREAAGNLIENAAKAARRKQALNIESEYNNVIALYKLDTSMHDSDAEAGENKSELPVGSKALLYGLVVIWVIICAFELTNKLKKRKKVGG